MMEPNLLKFPIRSLARVFCRILMLRGEFSQNPYIPANSVERCVAAGEFVCLEAGGYV